MSNQGALTTMLNKFRNVPTEVDGIKFDSKAEARRYGELKLLQMAGEIKELEAHKKFELWVAAKLICTYESDFTYFDFKKDKYVVEDVKSPATRKEKDYRIKVKLLKAIYGIEVVEIIYK